MTHWAASKRGRAEPVTCPLCRADWQDGCAPPPLGAPTSAGQYANLAAYSAAHRGADTSLESLYGDSAVWVRAHQGSRRRGLGH